MDATHNRAVISLARSNNIGGFQVLNLATLTFEPAFSTHDPMVEISEDPLIDPIRNLILSASEGNNYELVDITNSTSPKFYEQAVFGINGLLDSSGEECSTGIALAPAEGPTPSIVFITDLTQATFTPGNPAGTWNAPSQVKTLTESNLSSGASGIAVAQGTHTGIVTGEFMGDDITAIRLPSTSGSGTPDIPDWMSCKIGNGFENGFDPHTVTAYQSPNSPFHAIALLANFGVYGPTMVAKVDLTNLLDPAIVPRTAGGHACTSGTLPASVVSFITVP